MTSRIQRIGQTISNGVEHFTEFSARNAKPTTIKIIGVAAILLAMIILVAYGFGVYKFYTDVIGIQTCEQLKDAIGIGIFIAMFFAFPLGIFTFGLSSACFQYGKGMIGKAQVMLVDPKNPAAQFDL